LQAPRSQSKSHSALYVPIQTIDRPECDETKPRCDKCTTFRVSCSYEPDAPIMQVSFGGVVGIRSDGDATHSVVHRPVLRIGDVPPCPYPIIADGESVFQLDQRSLDRLRRFQRRTVLTIGSYKGARLWQKETATLTCSVWSPPDKPVAFHSYYHFCSASVVNAYCPNSDDVA